MIRKIVRIDEEKCNGCGLCVPSCAEGAIAIVDGKARLVSEVYCDGLGACLGECPQGAITIEEREAAEFDEEAANRYVAEQTQSVQPQIPSGCPGTLARELKRSTTAPAPNTGPVRESELCNWPVQLKLAPTKAPYFDGANLLLAADCVPFALADFHSLMLREKPVIVGCPKLDDPAFYAEKLTELLKQSDVKSLTVVHMEVPCCSGLMRIAEVALTECGKSIPTTDITVSIRGEIIAERRFGTVSV